MPLRYIVFIIAISWLMSDSKVERVVSVFVDSLQQPAIHITPVDSLSINENTNLQVVQLLNCTLLIITPMADTVLAHEKWIV